jgi:hypothetical protein
MGMKTLVSACLLSILGLFASFPQEAPSLDSSFFPALAPSLALLDSGTDATSAATARPPSSGFLGFKDKVAFHQFAGWTSGGLLLAAGVVGAIRAYALMEDGHAYREAMGIDDESEIGGLCSAEISGLWSASGGQTLRWVHVGLIAAGESLYLADAFTGLGFMGPLPPGYSRSKAHRYLFFAHAGLMATEVVLGFLTTDALASGNHELVRSLGVAHAGVGLAIPILILGGGAVMELNR